MFSLPSILIPIKFSERCSLAARYAISVAEHFNSEITFLHVLPPTIDVRQENPGAITMADLVAMRWEAVKKQLDDFLCAAFRHLRVKRILLEGDPAEGIIELAQRDKPDLIMMATHGSGPLRRLLLGSVTAKVLHDVDCPVWTAVHVEQGPTVEWITPSVIVCAIDLDQDGERTLRWASGMAAEYKAKLALVHVVPRLDSPGEEYYAKRYRSRVSEAVTQRIEELQRKLETRAEVQLETGEVERAVCSAASRLHANLLVIGRGLSDAPRLRTHTYAIIRDSPCPVVSV